MSCAAARLRVVTAVALLAAACQTPAPSKTMLKYPAVRKDATVDDYGEIWVNGNIDLSFGKSGRGAVSGFNTPNIVKLTDKAKPGETIQIAVLAINSPFGNPPNNGIFFRDPTVLMFFAPAESS